ncbi:MAG TPA: GAF domain-containing protein, partial [Schlesneria sp.]
MSGSGAADAVRRQQACLAQFGAFAFQEEDLSKMLTTAARACAACMEVPYVKICCHRPKEGDLFTVAGCGWGAGVLGHVAAKANGASTQARTFMTGKPVVIENISRDGGASLPAFYAEQGIASLAGVSIKGRTGPWGILEVADTEQRPFDEHDIIFLTGFANVVAEAVMAAERTAASQAAIESMKKLVAEKDKLLAERTRRELQLSELKVELLHVTR